MDDFIKIRPHRDINKDTIIDDNTAKQLQLFSDEVDRWHRNGTGRMWSGNIGKAIWLLVDRPGFRLAESSFEHNDCIEVVAEMEGEAERWRNDISEFEHIALYSFLAYTDFDEDAAREVLLEKFDRVVEHLRNNAATYPFKQRLTWHEHHTMYFKHMGIQHNPKDVAEGEC